MGEKPSDNNDTHEDWIQRQLRRPWPRGSTIAAQVGESAENVVAGKNIVPTIGNSLNIRPLMVFVILVGLVVLGAAGILGAYCSLQAADTNSDRTRHNGFQRGSIYE